MRQQKPNWLPVSRHEMVVAKAAWFGSIALAWMVGLASGAWLMQVIHLRN